MLKIHAYVAEMTDPSLIGTATVFEEEVTDELILEDINKHNETSSSSVEDIRIVSLKENKELVINSAEWLLKQSLQIKMLHRLNGCL